MDNNWAVHREQLDQLLELERTLARQRRQDRWQQFAGRVKRLHAFLAQPWQRTRTTFVPSQHA